MKRILSGTVSSKGQFMNLRNWRHWTALLFCLAFTSLVMPQSVPTADAPASTATPDIIPIPAAAAASSHFDANAATEAYLAAIPAQAKSRSDDYFEGGYWLILWDFGLG